MTSQRKCKRIPINKLLKHYLILPVKFIFYDKGNATLVKCARLWQTLPCWLNEKCVYVKFLESPPLFIPLANSYWPSTHPSLMREFLNITGCLTHILALNQTQSAHLFYWSCSGGWVMGGFRVWCNHSLKSSKFAIESVAGNTME